MKYFFKCKKINSNEKFEALMWRCFQWSADKTKLYLTPSSKLRVFLVVKQDTKEFWRVLNWTKEVPENVIS